MHPRWQRIGKIHHAGSGFGSASGIQRKCPRVWKKAEGIHRLSKVRVENTVNGVNVYIEVYVIFGFNIVNVLRDFKQRTKKEIERLTSMNVQEVSVMAKGIYMPESGEIK